jgi:hypothetical protein
MGYKTEVDSDHIFLGERLAHPQRDGSLKNKQDACRRRMERLVRFLFHETYHLNVFAFGLRCSEFGRYQLHSCETNSLIRNPAIHKRRLKNNQAAISPHSEPSVLLTSEIADLRNGKQSTTKVNAATNAYHPCGLGMRLIFIFLANVKEHATLSAEAHVDHGVEVGIEIEHVNRAADRGCCVSTCSLVFLEWARLFLAALEMVARAECTE